MKKQSTEELQGLRHTVGNKKHQNHETKLTQKKIRIHMNSHYSLAYFMTVMFGVE